MIDDAFVPCVDLGHGGEKTGAVYNGIIEKDFNLELGKKVDASFSGTNVVPVLTRRGDYNPGWLARYETAKRAGANIVVSIHGNANRDHNVSGVEAYYYPGNDYTREVGSVFCDASPLELRRSKVFATTDEPGPEDDWLDRPRSILKAFREIPAVVLECGYLTNPGDAGFIKMPWALDAIVCAIRSAIIRAAHLQEIRS